jgi:hypothetical protein
VHPNFKLRERETRGSELPSTEIDSGNTTPNTNTLESSNRLWIDIQVLVHQLEECSCNCQTAEQLTHMRGAHDTVIDPTIDLSPLPEVSPEQELARVIPKPFESRSYSILLE